MENRISQYDNEEREDRPHGEPQPYHHYLVVLPAVPGPLSRSPYCRGGDDGHGDLIATNEELWQWLERGYFTLRGRAFPACRVPVR